MVEVLWMAVLGAVLLVILFKVAPFRSMIVMEYQKGLRYRKGRFIGVLGPGKYWIYPRSSSIFPVDLRSEFITIQGQDVLSADGVMLKVSIAAEFQVADANVAINTVANYRGNLYLQLQMALREIIGKEKMDALLDDRRIIGTRLMEMCSPKAAEMGVKLMVSDIKDIMFSGEIKKAFAQVIKAQKEGQAALERARGESAALRNLANAARLMDDNPNLLQLRALQVMSESAGNTLVLGMPANTGIIEKQNKSASVKKADTEV
jgi:regulator of protease activity HflC (stomatin/prohibitin superfamily)